MSETGPNSGNSPAGGRTPRPEKRKRSTRKIWLFRLITLLLPLVALGLLECALRALGIGQDLSLIQRVPSNPNPQAHQVYGPVDLAYFGTVDLTGPEPRRLDVPKPEGTFRIVFVGASTVIGFPYLPEIAFPRQVEVQLQQQNPDLRFEVLNVGITGMSSFAVVDLLQQSLACDPDLVVVHSGHNEFYGPGGSASTAMGLPYHLVGPTFALRRCRVTQLLATLSPLKGPAPDDLMNILPRTLEIPLGGEMFEQAQRNYRKNLERAATIAKQNHVPIVLSTMACNLKDQSPLKAIWPSNISLAEQGKWEEHVSFGESLMREGKFSEAFEALLEAEKICGDHARLSYRKAQCLEALGKTSDAFLAYQKARDEDACRFRAPASFAGIVRDVAEESQAMFLDVEQLVNSESSPAGPGYDFFFEHVHYTFHGHQYLGRIFSQFIQDKVLQRPWAPDRVPSQEELEMLLGLVPEDHLAAYSSALKILQTGPFESALDGQHHKAYISQRIAKHYYALEPERRDAFADLSMTSMLRDLAGGLANIHRLQGNIELSDYFSRLAAMRRPWIADHPKR